MLTKMNIMSKFKIMAKIKNENYAAALKAGSPDWNIMIECSEYFSLT
jgi:hypothetical protein